MWQLLSFTFLRFSGFPLFPSAALFFSPHSSHSLFFPLVSLFFPPRSCLHAPIPSGCTCMCRVTLKTCVLLCPKPYDFEHTHLVEGWGKDELPLIRMKIHLLVHASNRHVHILLSSLSFFDEVNDPQLTVRGHFLRPQFPSVLFNACVPNLSLASGRKGAYLPFPSQIPMAK